MRSPRIKVPRGEEDAIHHCYSRTPNGEFLFGDADKEMFRIIQERVAAFCGVVILTYALLDNHYHQLVLVPRARPASDQELLASYRALYPKPTPHRPERIKAIAAKLKRGGPEAEKWRKWMMEMTDISVFEQLVKQHFTAWYNRRHERYGTLWAGRFGSTLVEQGTALMAVMAYVDLNAVRAGIVQDPKDYRFCGYAEAVVGKLEFRRAIAQLYGTVNWERAQAEYRMLLFAIGTKSKPEAAKIAEERCRQVLKEGGKLSLNVIVRCKVAYFTRGAVLGSQNFVEKHLQRLRERTGMKLRRSPISLVDTDWGEWTCLRAVRRRAGELVLVPH